MTSEDGDVLVADQDGASPASKRIDLDGIDLSVLAGGGSAAMGSWALKAQQPGAKVWLVGGAIAAVAGVGILLLSLVGLFVR